MKTLLQKAKEIYLDRRRSKRATEQEIELAIAWLKDEVTHKGIERVTGATGSNVYNLLAISLREAYRNKKIKV